MIYLTYLSKAKPSNDNKEFAKNQDLARDKRVTKKIASIDDIRVSEVCSNSIERFKSELDYAMVHFPLDRDMRNEYTIFNIPKRSGGVREIWAPSEDLKCESKGLLNMIVKDLQFLPHNAAHGFTKYRNTKTCMETHKRNLSRWFLKLDMSNFFPSWDSETLIDKILCVHPFELIGRDYLQRLVHLASVDGHLVQGNPLSPMLTNIAMVSVDDQIDRYCRRNGWTYTRYADDMQISSKYKEGLSETATVAESIQSLLPDILRINCDKTRFGSFAGRNWNLGLMFNNQYEITVGHARKHWVKVGLHKLEVGEEVDVAELGGVLAYCRYIEPDYFNPYWQRFLDLR